ncbi:hypothetical protein BX666DRAFT_2018118 [Dichotomocladium elegans]|nr:hypothetical protein BX666DRAFT_2018118 [Dichotomocladium elegans]
MRPADTTETALQLENSLLRQKIAELEAKLDPNAPSQPPLEKVNQLENHEIKRFGRQLILPEFGVDGGLGSPALLYLGAGGVGRLGIVDHDVVDISNLHRQVIHREVTQGVNKAVSAMMAVHGINPYCQVTPYPILLDSTNALDIIQQYDVVVDATDNVATRYLLNDACVLSGKPLVSGSALRLDGQLTVYNYNNGPCYRCLHPVPPPPETVTNCADGGVLGVANDSPSFLIFSGKYSPMFRTMKLRARKKDCIVCGDNPRIKELIDYVEFCGAGATDKGSSISLLKPSERISVMEYHTIVDKRTPHVLLDVRPPVQFGICSLPESLSIPLVDLESRITELKDKMTEKKTENVYVVCRLGNDSQLAVRLLQKNGVENARDIIGGLYKWATDVDESFPIY